jgi:hypothetical protein
VGAVAPRSLAVTAVDTWRRFKATEGLTLADFRADLLERTQTPRMLAGTAAHALLEKLPVGAVLHAAVPFLDVHPTFDEFFDEVHGFDASIEYDGRIYHVTIETQAEVDGRHARAKEVVDLAFELPDDRAVPVLPVREMKIERVYQTPVGPVLVKGRVDGFDNIEVMDYKFTGQPDLEALAETYQWRIYLDILDAQRFRWEVFTMRDPLRDETAWRICEVQSFTQFRYPNLQADVARAVAEAAVAIDTYAPEYWSRYERRAKEA